MVDAGDDDDGGGVAVGDVSVDDVSVVVFCRPSVFQMEGPAELNQGGRGRGVDDVGVAVGVARPTTNHVSFRFSSSVRPTPEMVGCITPLRPYPPIK